MTGVSLARPTHTQIESLLGRELATSEMGSVGSFGDFSDSDRDELRIIAGCSSVLVIAFIRYKLSGRTPLNDAVSYYDEVLRQGHAHETWIADRAAMDGQT